MKKLISAIFVVAFLMAGISFAAVPHLINYQGSLTDSSGNLLNGTYNITFKIYDGLTVGTILWQETHSGVTVQEGIFSVMLGSASALDLPFNIPYFLEIKVADEVMDPRQQITSVGYALRAENADSALNAANADNANTVGGKTYDSTDIKPFGDWDTAKTSDSVYYADTDGFVTAFEGSLIQGYADTNNPPMTLRAKCDTQSSSYITMPVKNGQYWKVTGAANVQWLPVGN